MALVVFDLDGTLVDSVPDIAVALDRALGAQGLPPLGAARVRTMVGEGARNLVTRALAAHGLPAPDAEIEAVLDRFRGAYRERLCVDSRVYPGVPALLAGLAGFARVVLTNKPGELARGLVAAAGLAPAFSRVIGDGDGHPRKPEPAALEALMAEAGVDRAGTVLVGDGLPDLALAGRAGVPLAAVTWGYGHRPDLEAGRPRWLVDNTADLLGILREWGERSARR